MVLNNVADALRADLGLDDLVRWKTQNSVATLTSADTADRRSEFPAGFVGLHFLRADLYERELSSVHRTKFRRQ